MEWLTESCEAAGGTLDDDWFCVFEEAECYDDWGGPGYLDAAGVCISLEEECWNNGQYWDWYSMQCLNEGDTCDFDGTVIDGWCQWEMDEWDQCYYDGGWVDEHGVCQEYVDPFEECFEEGGYFDENWDCVFDDSLSRKALCELQWGYWENKECHHEFFATDPDEWCYAEGGYFDEFGNCIMGWDDFNPFVMCIEEGGWIDTDGFCSFDHNSYPADFDPENDCYWDGGYIDRTGACVYLDYTTDDFDPEEECYMLGGYVNEMGECIFDQQFSPEMECMLDLGGYWDHENQYCEVTEESCGWMMGTYDASTNTCSVPTYEELCELEGGTYYAEDDWCEWPEWSFVDMCTEEGGEYDEVNMQCFLPQYTQDMCEMAWGTFLGEGQGCLVDEEMDATGGYQWTEEECAQERGEFFPDTAECKFEWDFCEEDGGVYDFMIMECTF